MKVIALRIPDGSKRIQLREFLESGIYRKSWNPFKKKNGFDPRSAKIVSCRIIRITEQNGVREMHGFAEIVPDEAARQAITRLHGKRLNGKLVIVRRYFDRSGRGDIDSLEERRRPNLIVDQQMHLEIGGLKQVSRSFSGG